MRVGNCCPNRAEGETDVLGRGVLTLPGAEGGDRKMGSHYCQVSAEPGNGTPELESWGVHVAHLFTRIQSHLISDK